MPQADPCFPERLATFPDNPDVRTQSYRWETTDQQVNDAVSIDGLPGTDASAKRLSSGGRAL